MIAIRGETVKGVSVRYGTLCGMARAMRHRTMVVIFFVLLLPLMAWGVYLSVLVVKNVRVIQSGKNPQEIAKRKQFQASIAKTIAEHRVQDGDRSRIEGAGQEPTLGNPNAHVRIVEFVDYQCPFSSREALILREFMRRHSADALLILRDFPILELHPDAERVAISARCVFDQGNLDRFWRYHDRLYASQDAQSENDLRLFAEQNGADLDAYDGCVASARPLAHIRASFADGVASGVEGTPTFFFNGVKIQGAIDAESLEIIFEEAKKH